MRHREPVKRSASVLPFALKPTAMHSDRDGQETLFSTPPPGGLGMGWTRQRRPFHCSASATRVRFLLVVSPTATHSAGDVQVTPVSSLDTAPMGFGAAWMVR